MQDHFIKNVNDLSPCMTFTSDRAGTNTKVCILQRTAAQGPCPLDVHYSNTILESHAVRLLLTPSSLFTKKGSEEWDIT